MDLLTLGFDLSNLVTTLLEFWNFNLSVETTNAAMAGNALIMTPHKMAFRLFSNKLSDRQQAFQFFSRRVASQGYNSLDHAYIDSARLLTLAAQPITTAEYWKQRAEVDTGQETTNPNLLSARISQRGGPFGAHDINVVLAQQGHVITQGELEKLVSIHYTEYPLTATGVKTSAFLSLYPRKVPANNGRWGVYVYINNITGVHYYGSSTTLHERIRYYWKKWPADKKLRPILADIKKYGLQNFTLRVYDFPLEFYELRFTLALEQYYMFSMYPANNSIMVAAGSPGGEYLRLYNSTLMSEPVYMYESGILLYVFKSISGQFDSVNSTLGINHNSVAFSIRDGSSVYGTLKFYMNPQDIEDVPLYETKEDVQKFFETLRTNYETDRVLRFAEFARQDSSTPEIKITRVSDGFVWKSPHIWGAPQLYKSLAGKTMTTETVHKRIKSGQALNGYVFALWTSDDKASSTT